jgi:hypothetical protein
VNWCARREAEVVREAHRVVIVTPLMARYVKEHYGPSGDRIVLAPNGSYVSSRQAVFAKSLAAVYAGNFAAFEEILQVVRTAERGKGRCTFWCSETAPCATTCSVTSTATPWSCYNLACGRGRLLLM